MPSRPRVPTRTVHRDVLRDLPSLLARALDTAEVAAAVEALVAAGWRAGQLRHRVGAAPSHGSTGSDAVAVLELLRDLSDQPCPDLLHEQARRRRELDRRSEQSRRPPVAAPAAVARHAAVIRATLPSPSPGTRRTRAVPRQRPACAVCGLESSHFVTRRVHLCAPCVDVLASGRARLRAVG